MPLPAPRALVLLVEGAEEIEVVVTVDVLRRGGVDVRLAGCAGKGPVRCSRDVILTPDLALLDAEKDEEGWDVVIVPGGIKGVDRLAANAAVGRVLKAQQEQSGLIAAICAGPLVLTRHGLFHGRTMTCHPSVRDQLSQTATVREKPVVEDNELITASGPGTAFHFALVILRRLQGESALAPVIGPLAFATAPDLPRSMTRPTT